MLYHCSVLEQSVEHCFPRQPSENQNVLCAYSTCEFKFGALMYYTWYWYRYINTVWYNCITICHQLLPPFSGKLIQTTQFSDFYHIIIQNRITGIYQDHPVAGFYLIAKIFIRAYSCRMSGGATKHMNALLFQIASIDVVGNIGYEAKGLIL